MNKKILGWVLAGVIVLGGLIFWQQGKTPTIMVGNEVVKVAIADTEDEQEQGLSGREGLGENEGMLFIFEKEGNYGFWMKDMLFPIDIAWISQDGTINHIEHSVSPSTYPEITFSSPVRSMYVLEMPAGFFQSKNIKIGDSIKM